MHHIIKCVFIISIVLLLLTPAIVGYILQLRIIAIANFAISIYGIYSLFYIILQIIFSEINERKIKKSPENWNEIPVGLIVVGYNENELLLKKCLESIKKNNYQNVRKIIFVIDGNTSDNNYMFEIYKEVFNNNLFRMDYFHSQMNYSLFWENNEPICIMQPHNGKREGLMTGFKILMYNSDIKVIVTTDSDTILDTSAIKELVYQCNESDIGAVAGQIDIWNTSDSLLSHIVAYRYWLSFNLERASESFWKTVMCVAGPMACYKVSVLTEILDSWYNQTFLGQRCTFGDDRHLTNRVLLTGKKVIYTKYAKGYTDTPSTWGIYLRQQTRWSKSFFREFLFNMQSVHLHPIWMCYELLYNVLYFFLLMYWSIYILYFCSIYQQSIAIIITLVMGLLKSLYGVIKTKNPRFILFFLYSFIYFLIIIPAKLTALVTLYNNNWGTRSYSKFNNLNYISSIIWISTLIGGFSFSIYKNHDFNFDKDYKYKIAFIGWIIYILFILFSIITEYICRKFNIFSNKIEKEIKQSNINHL